MANKRANIPRRDEIEALIAHGSSNQAIAVALAVPHRQVARVRKIIRERERYANGRKSRPSPEALANKRRKGLIASRKATDQRIDAKTAAFAESSLYRKVAMMRRVKVLEMLTEGKSQAEMAVALDVGETTIGAIVAALEGRRQWRRQASVQVLLERDVADRIKSMLGRGKVSGWIAGLIDAELARIDRASAGALAADDHDGRDPRDGDADPS